MLIWARSTLPSLLFFVETNQRAEVRMASALIWVAQCSASDTKWPSTKTLGASGSAMAASPNRRVKYAKLGPKPWKNSGAKPHGWENMEWNLVPFNKVGSVIYNPPIGSIYHLYIAYWVIIYHLPPIQGTRNSCWVEHEFQNVRNGKKYGQKNMFFGLRIQFPRSFE